MNERQAEALVRAHEALMKVSKVRPEPLAVTAVFVLVKTSYAASSRLYVQH